MSDETKQERIYRRIENFYAICSRNAFYSMQRIDLIIIALSTGGVVVLLNFYRFNLENDIENNPLLLWSMGFFIITIACNLISQWFAYKTHTIESEWAEEEMKYLNGLIEENTIGESDNYNRVLGIFNYSSYLFLTLACILFFCLLT